MFEAIEYGELLWTLMVLLTKSMPGILLWYQ